MQPILIATDRGEARVQLEHAEAGRGALVLGHGAGGGVNAPDLAATAAVALGAGLDVALVEQPYRVAGRRAPAPASHLDAAWLTVVEPELEAVPVPMLVVQGDRDRFGMPAPGPDRSVVTVSGDHSLRADLDAVRRAVGDWLTSLPALSA